MNKVHHIVWNKTLSVWQAASENTKSNTKNGKAFRLNTLTSVLALSFLGWFFPQIASAGCDIPAIPASNSVVTCTGTTSGTYTIRNVQNVQLTNEGAWNLSGTSLGIVNADTGDLTGLVVTNKGTMTWDDAMFGGSGTGSRAVINVYTSGNAATQATTVNDSTGVINLNVLSSLGNNRGLAGMAVYGGGANSRVFWNNAGQINVNSTSNNANNTTASAGFIRGRSQADVVNTGTLTVSELSGNTALSGLRVYMAGGSTVPVSATLTNSGTILLSSPTASFASGVEMVQVAANSGGLPSSFKLNNSGTIQLDTNPAKGYVVKLSSNSVANVSFDIDNSGSLLAKDSSGWAVVLDGGATQTAKVTLNNTGTIVGNIWTESGNDIYTQDSGSLIGSTYLGAGDDTFTATGGSIVGSVYLADGSDTATISNIDLSTIPTLDGGDDTLVADGFIDTLTLSNTSVATTELLNWEKIVLDATTFASPNNTLSTGTDPGYGLFLTNGSLLNAGTAFNLTGNLDIDSTSTFQGYGAGSGVYAVSGSVTNAGTITTQDGAAGDVITVGGDYTGVSGSTYKIDTVLGNDSSITDNLAITGNASGATAINVANVGGTGAQTVEGIKIVDVQGKASPGVFTLASPVEAGAYEYVLLQGGVSTPTDGDWYLRSTLIPTPTEPATPIYRPGTSNYVSAQTANAEQGFLALGTLHERMNEQQVVSTDKQTWARIYGNTESNNGDSRFNYNQHISAVQVGQDLYNKTTDNGTDVHSGIMFDYSNSEVDFADRVREDALLDNTTGNLEARSYGIGGYYTAINGDESYLDVVGMVSKLDNKFEDSYGMKSTQDGYRLGLSVEAGKKLAELGKWKVEGQGQLAYQYTNYDNFNDDISGIDGYGASTLRGRLGVRVYRHLESTKEMKQIDNAQVYGVANVIQDFINPTDVAVGGTNVSEKFDKTTLEVGGGFQVPVTGTTYVYTDARYDRSIKGNKEQGKLTIGFKTQF